MHEKLNTHIQMKKRNQFLQKTRENEYMFVNLSGDFK